MSDDPAKTIRVWRWQDAPECYTRLSRNGGDEDWIAVLPTSVYGAYPPLWADEGTPFGGCTVERHDLGAYFVLIGSHA